MEREPTFSVTRDECEWSYSPHGGKGGQNANKNATAVTVVHRPSGATGHCAETKSQWQNRRVAFRRMAQTPEFLKWARRQSGRVALTLQQIEAEIQAEVEEQMQVQNLLIETWDGTGWQKSG